MEKQILYKKNDGYNWKIGEFKQMTPLLLLTENLLLDLRYNPILIDSLINWYKKNHGREVYRGGVFCIVTLNDQSVIIGSADDIDLENENELFRTTKEKMIKILETWKTIMQMDPLPNKIVFTQGDNGDVTISPEE